MIIDGRDYLKKLILYDFLKNKVISIVIIQNNYYILNNLYKNS